MAMIRTNAEAQPLIPFSDAFGLPDALDHIMVAYANHDADIGENEAGLSMAARVAARRDLRILRQRSIMYALALFQVSAPYPKDLEAPTAWASAHD